MTISKSPIVQGKIRSRKLDNLEKHLAETDKISFQDLEFHRMTLGTHPELFGLLFQVSCNTYKSWRGTSRPTSPLLDSLLYIRARGGDSKVFYPSYSDKHYWGSFIPSKKVGKAQDSTKPESRIALDAVGSSVSNDNLEKKQSGVTLPGPFEQRLDRNTERQIQKLHAPQPGDDYDHCECSICMEGSCA